MLTVHRHKAFTELAVSIHCKPVDGYTWIIDDAAEISEETIAQLQTPVDHTVHLSKTDIFGMEGIYGTKILVTNGKSITRFAQFKSSSQSNKLHLTVLFTDTTGVSLERVRENTRRVLTWDERHKLYNIKQISESNKLLVWYNDATKINEQIQITHPVKMEHKWYAHGLHLESTTVTWCNVKPEQVGLSDGQSELTLSVHDGELSEQEMLKRRLILRWNETGQRATPQELASGVFTFEERWNLRSIPSKIHVPSPDITIALPTEKALSEVHIPCLLDLQCKLCKLTSNSKEALGRLFGFTVQLQHFTTGRLLYGSDDNTTYSINCNECYLDTNEYLNEDDPYVFIVPQLSPLTLPIYRRTVAMADIPNVNWELSIQLGILFIMRQSNDGLAIIFPSNMWAARYNTMKASMLACAKEFSTIQMTSSALENYPFFANTAKFIYNHVPNVTNPEAIQCLIESSREPYVAKKSIDNSPTQQTVEEHASMINFDISPEAKLFQSFGTSIVEHHITQIAKDKEAPVAK
jgi:hypothetical protein